MYEKQHNTIQSSPHVIAVDRKVELPFLKVEFFLPIKVLNLSKLIFLASWNRLLKLYNILPRKCMKYNKQKKGAIIDFVAQIVRVFKRERKTK